jgi:hypothetical protein
MWPAVVPPKKTTVIAASLPTDARTSWTPRTRQIPPLGHKHPLQHLVQTLMPLRYTPFPFSISVLEFYFQAYDTHRGLCFSFIPPAHFHISILRLPTSAQRADLSIRYDDPSMCQRANFCGRISRMINRLAIRHIVTNCHMVSFSAKIKTELLAVCSRVLYPVAHPVR